MTLAILTTGKYLAFCPWALWTAMAQSTGFPKNLHWCLCDDTIRIWQDCLKALMDVMCVRRTFVPGFIHSRTCQSGESHKIRTMCLKPESLAFRNWEGGLCFLNEGFHPADVYFFFFNLQVLDVNGIIFLVCGFHLLGLSGFGQW